MGRKQTFGDERLLWVASEPPLWLVLPMRLTDFGVARPTDLLVPLQASWDGSTAYAGACEPGNVALGQCYPTARVVQSFFPRFEIARGRVDTGSSIETHYWNVDPHAAPAEHVDLTWSQFRSASHVIDFELLDRRAFGDSAPTVLRCELLVQRVIAQLNRREPAAPGRYGANF